MTSLTLSQVRDEMLVLKNMEAEDVLNTIVEAFGDYEFDGDTYVELGSPHTMGCFSVAEEVVHSAGIEADPSGDIQFTLTQNPDGTWNVEDAWLHTC